MSVRKAIFLVQGDLRQWQYNYVSGRGTSGGGANHPYLLRGEDCAPKPHYDNNKYDITPIMIIMTSIAHVLRV